MNTFVKKLIVMGIAVAATTTLAVRAGDAKENFEKNCSKCHGSDGKGDTKMGKKLEVKDYTDAKVQADMKDDEMVKTIKQGKKDGEKTRMKPFGEVLNDEEIKALAAYVRAFKK
ncbi:MAG: c-type cytochrome [Limisphaerales bacterium]